MMLLILSIFKENGFVFSSLSLMICGANSSQDSGVELQATKPSSSTTKKIGSIRSLFDSITLSPEIAGI